MGEMEANYGDGEISSPKTAKLESQAGDSDKEGPDSGDSQREIIALQIYKGDERRKA